MHAVIQFINAVNFLIILQSAAGYVAFIGSLCGGTVECITAQANLATNTACTTAFSTGTDTDAICVGTCRDLFNAIIRSCDSAVSQTIWAWCQNKKMAVIWGTVVQKLLKWKYFAILEVNKSLVKCINKS